MTNVPIMTSNQGENQVAQTDGNQSIDCHSRPAEAGANITTGARHWGRHLRTPQLLMPPLLFQYWMTVKEHAGLAASFRGLSLFTS